MIYRSDAGRRSVQAAYREMLSRWPVEAEQRTVATSQGDTFVVVSGSQDAPPLVLLHGSTTNAAMWMGDVAAWAESFRVYAVDVIGEPGLSAPSRPPLGSDAYVQWLDDVLQALGIEQTSLVGASLGGWMAVDYATRRPERVTRLVLLCPGGIGRQKYGWLPKVILLRPFGRWGMRKSLESVAGLKTPDAREILDYMALINREFRPRKGLPVFPDDTLARLTMPVLVIVGERDAMLDSRDTVRRVRRSVPHAITHLLPGVGHSIVGETATVLAFLHDEG
jgi:pimeloyl-ACP methyl ester carboxylesterase